MTTEVIPKQVLGTYLESRQRYLVYYLELPKNAADDPGELEFEIPNLQHAFRWALESGNNTWILEFWNNVKDFLWDRGHWRIFIDWGGSTLRALRQLNTPEDEAWVLSELGWFWMEQGEFTTAKEMFEQARDIFGTIDHRRGICALERYLGVLAYRTVNLDQAAQHYETALRLATAENLKGMIAEIKNQKGCLARKMGDFAEARHLYQEAKEEFEHLEDKWRLTCILRNLARLEHQLGNLEAAKCGFMQAIALCEQIGRKDMLFGCQFWMAQIELIFSNHQEAKALAISARNGFAELGMKQDLQRANELLNTF